MKPGEHKTVQARILAYADAIGWTRVSREEAERRWDVAELKEKALESQRRRRFIAPVLRDQASSWDYQPPASAGASYIRNTMPIGELERRARFPAV